MSKKQIGIIPNNGDVHTAQIGVHIGRVGVCVYVREYWKYKSWFVVPGVSVDAVNGYDRYVDIEAKILFVGIGIRFIWIKRKVRFYCYLWQRFCWGRVKARTNQRKHFIYYKNPRAWKKETSL